MAFSLSRRSLLRGAGAAVSLPLLESMFEKYVYAQVANPPKRFVFVYCGIPPVGEGVDSATGKPKQFVCRTPPGRSALPSRWASSPWRRRASSRTPR